MYLDSNDAASVWTCFGSKHALAHCGNLKSLVMVSCSVRDPLFIANSRCGKLRGSPVEAISQAFLNPRADAGEGKKTRKNDRRCTAWSQWRPPCEESLEESHETFKIVPLVISDSRCGKTLVIDSMLTKRVSLSRSLPCSRSHAPAQPRIVPYSSPNQSCHIPLTFVTTHILPVRVSSISALKTSRPF